MSIKEIINNFIEFLKGKGINVTEEQRHLLEDALNRKFEYKPRIGFFGQTGVGKSSTINALFGSEICPVGKFAESCTRDMKDVPVGSVTLVDYPGLGEDTEKDSEYKQLYRDTIPDLDAVVWVLDSTTKAYANDIATYNFVKDNFKDKDGNKIPVLFVLNKVDKINTDEHTEDGEEEPWNREYNKPGDVRQKLIEEKKTDVCTSQKFNISPASVFPISAKKAYGLVDFVVSLLKELPNEKAAVLYNNQTEIPSISTPSAPTYNPAPSAPTYPTYNPVPSAPTYPTYNPDPVYQPEPINNNPWRSPKVTTIGERTIGGMLLDAAEHIPVIGTAIKFFRKYI